MNNGIKVSTHENLCKPRKSACFFFIIVNIYELKAMKKIRCIHYNVKHVGYYRCRPDITSLHGDVKILKEKNRIIVSVRCGV